MLQKFIYQALVKGHGAYRAGGQAIFEDLFGRVYEYSSAECAEIRAYFQANEPEVFHGFPRAEIGNRPVCFVFTMSESQPGFALNDYGGTGGAPTTPAAAGMQLPGVAQQVASPATSGLGGAFILASLWTHQFQILSLARGAPEPVLWLTEINKSILLAAKNFFLSKAMQTVVLAASDVQFREDLAPADLFAKAITLQCGREFSQADTSQSLQRAFQLDGLVAPPGSVTHPPGRPFARVTPIAPVASSGNDPGNDPGNPMTVPLGTLLRDTLGN